MNFQRWLLAVALFLLARIITYLLPSVQGVLPSRSEPLRQGTEQASADICQSMRPAVVMLYAGSEFGSGSIVSPDGLVLTNYHVVKQAQEGLVRAKTWAGTLYTGQIIATDPVQDLALVQLNTHDRFPTIRLASSDTMQAGHLVCAIGSPFGRAGILTRGTLTGFRSNGDLQSAILLYPGNSGGPLLNMQGDLIGVNKTIWRSSTGENTGISFSVSAIAAKTFIEQHQSQADFNAKRFLASDSSPSPSAPSPLDFGVHSPATATAGTDPLPPEGLSGARLGVIIDQQSLVIQVIEPNSPAEIAGLAAGDRIVAVNGDRLQGFDQLQAWLNQRPIAAVFTISRNHQLQTIQVHF